MTMRQLTQLHRIKILPRNIVSVVMSHVCAAKVVVIHRLQQSVAQALLLTLTRLTSTHTQ